MLRALINREVVDSVGCHLFRQPLFPSLGFEFDIGFSPDDRERSDTVNSVQIAEIIVASV